VAEAARTGRHPERMSPDNPPAPFDQAVYRRDRDAYLSTVEPGRVHQTKAEEPGVRWLESVSPLDIDVPYLGSVELRVRGEPDAPVTFVTYDMGLFDNGLGSISVRTDAEGIARVTWRGQPGVTNLVTILAGSPLTAGQVRFSLNVATP
jgi:hypothetical protein